MNAFILTGGHSRRMGQDKSLLTLGNRTFTEILYEEMLPHFDSVTVVGKEKTHPDLPFLKDKLPEQCSMIGIYTALEFSSSSWNFIISVDMPAVTAELAQFLYRHVDDAHSILLPQVDGRQYPTCAWYHTSLSDALYDAISAQQFRLMKFVSKNDARIINTSDYRKKLMNVNTPVDYRIFSRMFNNER